VSVTLLIVGATLLMAPGAARPWLRRLPPRDWADLVTAALVAGLVLVEVGLATLAAPTVLRSVGWSGLARACERMFRSLAVGGPLVGWLSAAGTLALAGRAGWRLLCIRRLHRRARVEPALGEHYQRGDCELVILPSREPVAYSLGGRRPQVVLSTGLTSALSAAQLDAVIGHERSHLRHRHGRRLAAAAAVDAAARIIPGVRGSTASLRTALERWADEDTAGSDGDARARLRSALLAAAHAAVAPEVAAFGGAYAAVERVAALGRPAPAPALVERALAWAVLVGVWLVGVSAFGLWIGRTRSVLAMAGYCPS
jgi:hypothetical protein